MVSRQDGGTLHPKSLAAWMLTRTTLGLEVFGYRSELTPEIIRAMFASSGPIER
jgi:hypothetical protein